MTTQSFVPPTALEIASGWQDDLDPDKVPDWAHDAADELCQLTPEILILAEMIGPQEVLAGAFTLGFSVGLAAIVRGYSPFDTSDNARD